MKIYETLNVYKYSFVSFISFSVFVFSPERMPRIIGEGGKGGGVKNQLVSSHKFQDYEVTLLFLQPSIFFLVNESPEWTSAD
jgi:hypothetical protein